MFAVSVKRLRDFMNRPLPGKAERACAVVIKAALAVCPIVVLLWIILFMLSPQVHWMVFVAKGSPDPPRNYSGTWLTWDPSGTLIAREQYAHGKLDGPITHWDSKGREQLEAFYRTGKLSGAWTSFHKNGSVCERREYVVGIPTGHRIKFYQNGATNYECFHSRPGAIDGPEIVGTTNGELKVLRTWRDGHAWDGRFWSLSNGDSILTIYGEGRFISETNLGPFRSPALRSRTGPARVGESISP